MTGPGSADLDFVQIGAVYMWKTKDFPGKSRDISIRI